jgi:hypothetical protein
MDHVLAECGLRLTYLRDPYAIQDLDQDQILHQLSENDPNSEIISWIRCHQLTDYDHVVLAADRWTGQSVGLLVARDETTPSEPFLLMEYAFVAKVARRRNLTRRMIALMILRISGLSSAPAIIAARASTRATYLLLRGLADRFSRSRFFPEPDKVTVSLDTAALARRIAREIYPGLRFGTPFGAIRGATGMMRLAGAPPDRSDSQIDTLFGGNVEATDQILTVLDLRGKDEDSITGDARCLYRGG